MNEADAKELLQQAIWIALTMSAPAVISAMAVGLVISVLQALTQIQEVTLTFVPKIIVVLLMIVAMGPFMGAQISLFADEVYARIERVR